MPVHRQRAVVIGLPDATRDCFHLSSRHVAWPCRFCLTKPQAGGQKQRSLKDECRRENVPSRRGGLHKTEQNSKAAMPRSSTIIQAANLRGNRVSNAQ